MKPVKARHNLGSVETSYSITKRPYVHFKRDDF